MDIFLFPGQGSQKLGMGGDLFDEVDEFRALEPEIDALLGYSIRQQYLEDPAKRLNDTRYSQPSLYVIPLTAPEQLTRVLMEYFQPT